MKKRFTLMVVEDDLAVREAITRVLEAEGYQVSSATTRHDAIHQFDQSPVDMVLLDLNLGKEEGWTVFDALKERRPGLPIFVTSGRAEALKHSSAARASGLLEKPFDMPVLLALLGQASLTTAVQAKLELSSASAITPTQVAQFPYSSPPKLPKAGRQTESAHSAQDVEQQQITPSSSDGISPAYAQKKRGRI